MKQEKKPLCMLLFYIALFLYLYHHNCANVLMVHSVLVLDHVDSITASKALLTLYGLVSLKNSRLMVVCVGQNPSLLLKLYGNKRNTSVHNQGTTRSICRYLSLKTTILCILLYS